MSKLKNIFGLPESLVSAVKEIHESSAQFSKDMTNANKAEIERLNSEKELRDTRKATTPKQQPTVMKMKEETLNEIGDTPKGQRKLIDVIKRRQAQGYVTDKDPVQKQASKRLEKHAEVINNSFEPDEASLNEANGTYPFKANEMAPLIGTLRMLLNFLASSPSLKKIMKEETGVDESNVDSLVNFLEVLGEELELIEYRTKGAVGKKKQASMSTTSSATPKKSEDDEEEEDEGPAYQAASGKDQEHIMTQLKGAMDDERGGRHIDTASGKKYVSKDTASKIHSHLMGLKAPERAQSSSDLYNLKATHPMTKHIQDDHRDASQRGIKAPTEKKGRGRPKKVVD